MPNKNKGKNEGDPQENDLTQGTISLVSKLFQKITRKRN